MNDEKESAMSVPDGLPTLSYGAHNSGSGNACVMELVSVLAGETWSDGPRCTNGELARVARAINDTMDDEYRQGLIEIAPLLVSTAAKDSLADMRLDMRVSDRYEELLAKAYSEIKTVGLYMKFSVFCNEQGVEVLRELAQLCDEFNGYDRSTQEPQPVVETLTKIHERAGAL